MVSRNTGDPPAELADAFAEVNRRHLPELPPLCAVGSAVEGYQRFLDAAEDGIRRTTGFDEPEQRRYAWEQRYTTDDWLDQVPNSGFFAQIDAARARALLADIGAAIDAYGGAFLVQYTTVLVTAGRRPSS